MDHHSSKQASNEDRTVNVRVRQSSGTNRDWLAERAKELGLRPPAQMSHLHVRTLRSA